MVAHLIIVASLWAAPDSLDTDIDTVRVEDVVVTASRLEQRRSDAPLLVSTTDAQVFRAVQAVSLSEGLAFQPGLRVEQNCQNCGFTQVRLNGLQGPYTQILIDSRPIFSSLNGVYGLEQIPSRIVERIEVTRGGGSALYGAGAIAGTINVITREPFQTAASVQATPALIGGSALDNVYSADASAVSSDYLTGVTLFGTTRNRDWYDRNADAFSELVALKSSAGGLKAFHYFSPDDRLSVEGHWTREFRRGGQMTTAAPEASAITEQLDHSIAGGSATYERTMLDDRARLAVYASGQSTIRHSYYGGNGGDSARTEEAKAFYGHTTDVIGVAGVQYSLVRTISSGVDALTVVGIEATTNDVVDNMPGYGRSIDQRTTGAAAYAQIQYAVGAPLSVSVGARLDAMRITGYYGYQSEEPISGGARDYLVLNPRLSVVGKVSAVSQLRLSYAMGFRGPQAFDEDFHISTLQGAARTVQLAPGLRPERSHSLSLSLDVNDQTILRSSGGTVDAFVTLLQNPFVTALTPQTNEGGGRIATKQNGDAAYVAGVNAEYRMAITRTVEVQVGGTVQLARYATAQTVAAGEVNSQPVVITTPNILRTPAMYGSAVASWTPWHEWQFDLSSVVTGPMDALNERTLVIRRTPWFVDLGVKAGYNIHVGDRVEMNIALGISNVLDAYQSDLERGADRDASYIYGPFRPRTVTVTLSTSVE